MLKFMDTMDVVGGAGYIISSTASKIVKKSSLSNVTNTSFVNDYGFNFFRNFFFFIVFSKKQKKME
jgi:hypothetical protein